MKRKSVRGILAVVCLSFVLPAIAAVPASPPAAPKDEEAKYQYLRDAANAVVGIKVKALANARSAATLGIERFGSGVVIENGLVHGMNEAPLSEHSKVAVSFALNTTSK